MEQFDGRVPKIRHSVQTGVDHIRLRLLYSMACLSTSAKDTKRGRRQTLLLVLCLGFLWYMSAGEVGIGDIGNCYKHKS